MLKLLDLFSGIGGFSLAASWTGQIETIAFCEIETYCQKVLNKHWPEVPVIEDIKELKNEGQYGAVDIISGGFPCQPFSVAGKQRGKEDDRYLWPEMFRVIKEFRPPWVIGENVSGFLNMGLETAVADLESEGYEVETIVIPACGLSAPHKRDRVWVLGYSRHNDRPTNEKPGNNKQTSKHGQEGKDPAEQFKRSSCCERRAKILAHPVSNTKRGTHGKNIGASIEKQSKSEPERCEMGCNTRNNGENVPNTDKLNDDKSRLRAGQLSQFKTPKIQPMQNWESEPGVGRMVDGLSFELDFVRRIMKYYEQTENKKAKSEKHTVIREVLRTMWKYQELAKTSRKAYIKKLQNCIPGVPCPNTYERWLLSPRIKENKNLCNMWQQFYSNSKQKVQNLQFKLLEQAQNVKRKKTLGSRVNRLKGLGNAIVPQVAYVILSFICDIEGDRCEAKQL